MSSRQGNIAIAGVMILVAAVGCARNAGLVTHSLDSFLQAYQTLPLQEPEAIPSANGLNIGTVGADSPEFATSSESPSEPFLSDEGGHGKGIAINREPRSVKGADSEDWQPPLARNMAIDEAIQIALKNSTVLRDFGARVVEAPGVSKTIYGPSIRANNAADGVNAALSAFDAQLSSDFLFEDNHQLLNNRILGLGANDFRQTLYRSKTSLSKKTAAGTEFILRNNVTGDRNSSTSNLARARAWNWELETEIRQPLLLGRGVEFNQIAGPDATLGGYKGVRLARLNVDVSVSELQVGLRDYLSNVQNAYWDLYFAYENLAIKREARDRSRDTAMKLIRRKEEKIRGAEIDKVARAEEQYFLFEEEVQNALAGKLLLGTRNFNGSGGGTFQGMGGVYACERRLRMILGIKINDEKLIYTSTKPSVAPISHAWADVVSNALTRRTELRTQQLRVEKKRLELIASKAFAKPRLDAIGAYRYRGLGDRIYGTRVISAEDGEAVYTPTHEWWGGLSLAYPVGQRQAHSAIRGAQLEFARAQALLVEVERRIVLGVSNARAECDRAQKIVGLANKRCAAAKLQYATLQADEVQDARDFDYNGLLDSQQRLSQAESSFLRARVQHELALKNLHFEQGTLLDFLNIHLASESWPTSTTKIPQQKIAQVQRHLKALPEMIRARLGKSGVVHSSTAETEQQKLPQILDAVENSDFPELSVVPPPKSEARPSGRQEPQETFLENSVLVVPDLEFSDAGIDSGNDPAHSKTSSDMP
ncbi:MAG: hypothetical protein CL917_04195 [Deltaproteobacteria bacterium]|nr:hypothetical protein [Deltaproteobacteria bacterium]